MASARIPLIAGNWKMNKGTAAEATALAEDLLALLIDKNLAGRVQIVLCPPFTALSAVHNVLDENKTVTLGAQNVFWKESGAYTGQISSSMLVDAGVKYVLIGHSETRGRFGVAEADFTSDVLKIFGESDETVNRKTKASLAAGLTPIICIGETLGERVANQTDAVIAAQVTNALAGIDAGEIAQLIFAYEPVWAIGTGKTCSGDEADRVCGVVRQTVQNLTDVPTAQAVRIQYGGSMKPDNAADLLKRPNIDGGLIGGAALKAADFAAIVEAAVSSHVDAAEGTAG